MPLITRSQKLVARRLTIRLPGGVWSKLDSLIKQAREVDMDVDIEAALAAYLSRQIVQAERTLESQGEPTDQ